MWQINKKKSTREGVNKAAAQTINRPGSLFIDSSLLQLRTGADGERLTAAVKLTARAGKKN